MARRLWSGSGSTPRCRFRARPQACVDITADGTFWLTGTDQDTGNFNLQATNGSHIVVHTADHLSTNANGVVTVSFSTFTRTATGGTWASIGSVRGWPHPTGADGADRDRTDDLLVANQMLSQLSYRPGPPQSTVSGLPARLTD